MRQALVVFDIIAHTATVTVTVTITVTIAIAIAIAIYIAIAIVIARTLLFDFWKHLLLCWRVVRNFCYKLRKSKIPIELFPCLFFDTSRL